MAMLPAAIEPRAVRTLHRAAVDQINARDFATFDQIDSEGVGRPCVSRKNGLR